MTSLASQRLSEAPTALSGASRVNNLQSVVGIQAHEYN